ncbi:MAG: phospholipid/glycerol acyltransferase [Gammaproteobacteria bacterium]|jgi:1-acyl-sn-glycerol-3-phosphate acyltransferase|nr:phospholipid/glycerol acyltransferase [Gammaproteobacteria bacterium]
MKKIKNFLIFWRGFPVLFMCMLVVIRHSLYITFLAKKKRLTRAVVNQRLNKGARQILALIGANHSIRFMPGFKMDSKTPYIFMANHASLFDLPLLYANMSGTIRFLVKKSLFDMPFFGDAITQTEFLPIDMRNPDSMQALFNQIKEKLKSGVRIFIFPEGGRTRTEEMLSFKPGGFRLARETGAHIIPVGITGTREAMPAKTFLLKRGVPLSLCVGHPIDTAPFQKIESQKSLMEKVEKEIRALMQCCKEINQKHNTQNG